MKKSLLLLAALACTGAVAQEKEIWACQQEVGTQLRWESGSWERSGVAQTQLLLTIDGEKSSYKELDYERSLECSFVKYYDRRTACKTSTGDLYILIETATGRMGKTYLSGAFFNTDSISAQKYNCTKF